MYMSEFLHFEAGPEQRFSLYVEYYISFNCPEIKKRSLTLVKYKISNCLQVNFRKEKINPENTSLFICAYCI